MENKTDTPDVAMGVTGAIVIPGMIVLSLVFHGWVFQKLWGWFAVTIFAVRPLTVAQAIGVSMLAYPVRRSYDGEDKRPGWRRVADPFWMGLLALLCGYVVRRFI